MRLNQILTEAEQQELKVLQEGPLGSLAKAAGRGVGNVIGGVAKGVGAVKGAVKGAVDRVKKDFSAGEKGAYDALAGKPAAGGAAAPAAKPAAGGSAPAGSGATAKPAVGGGAPAASGAPSSGGATAKPAAPAAGGDATPASGAAPEKTGTMGDFAKGFKKGIGVKGTDDGDEQTTGGTKPSTGGTASGGSGTTAQPSGAEPADPNAPADGSTTAEPAGDAATPAAGGKSAGGKPAAGGNKAPAPNAAGGKSDTEYTKAQKAVDGLAPEQRKEIIAILQADPKVKAAMSAKPAAAKPANTMAGAPVSKVNKAKPGNPNAAPAAKAEPTATTGTVQQKQLTNKGFGQMVGGLTKKAG